MVEFGCSDKSLGLTFVVGWLKEFFVSIHNDRLGLLFVIIWLIMVKINTRVGWLTYWVGFVITLGNCFSTPEVECPLDRGSESF